MQGRALLDGEANLHEKLPREADKPSVANPKCLDFRGVLALADFQIVLDAPPIVFGEGNRDVLREAGYSAAEIDDLVARGIVIDRMRKPPED